MFKRLIVALLLLTAFAASRAQEDASEPLSEQLHSIQRKVIFFRGLERLAETSLHFPAPAELETFLSRQFRRDYPPRQQKSDQVFLQALELAPAGLDLEAALRDYWLAWLGGYYDVTDGSINIALHAEHDASDSLTVFQQIIYAHEFAHALQDQHFNLKRIIDESNIAGDRDRRLATHALFEGDAEYITREFLDSLFVREPEAVMQAYADYEEPEHDPNIPPVIYRASEFPYRQGLQFVEALLAARGWGAVNQALRDNPPQSTEQIYHPQRYLAGEGAMPVTMPDLDTIVGGEWRRAYDGPVGEFYLRQHLSLFLAPAQTDALASGWGGDRMRIFSNAADDRLQWALYQKWDTPQDAREFAQGYRQLLERRFGQVSADERCWLAERTVCLALVGAHETRLAAAPSPQNALALLALDT